MQRRICAVTCALVLMTCCISQALGFDIIAHRGASGYLPEHTLPSTALAHAQQPDYIEQDVVLSRDGVPIVLHDIHLDTVTNVEAVFPDRAREDGRYYVIDFTLSELRQLQVHERENAAGRPIFPGRFRASNVGFRIATLAEHIALIQALNRLRKTAIGFYVEIKSPAWHKAQQQDISRIVLDELAQLHLTAPSARLIIQCFDLTEIRRIRNELNYEGTLILLVGDNEWQESDTDYSHIRTPAGIREIADVVDGIGPWIEHLLPADHRRDPVIPAWVKTAHQHHMLIHPYTFRTDDLPTGIDAKTLIRLLYDTYQVDGVFTDQVPPVKLLINSLSH